MSEVPENRTAADQVSIVRAMFSDTQARRPPKESFEVGIMSGMLIRFDKALRDIAAMDPDGSGRAEMMRQVAWDALQVRIPKQGEDPKA